MPIVCQAIVQVVQEISNDIREYVFKPDKYVNYEAGQFLQLTVDLVTASEIWPESRTFSIASFHSTEKPLRLIIKRVGYYTARLFDLLIQVSRCTIKYAYGDFTLLAFNEESPILCIARGTVIAPFLAFIGECEERGQLERLFVYNSAKTQANLIDHPKIKKSIPQGHLNIF